MSLPATAPQELVRTVNLYHGFGAICQEAAKFRAAHVDDPLYIGAIGRVILDRHTVAVIRDSAETYNFNDFNENGLVANVLEVLGLPHAEVLPGKFNPRTHQQLFSAFVALRQNRVTDDESAALTFVEAVNVLTPDARDDNERSQIAGDLLRSVGLPLDYADRLTMTPVLSSLTIPTLAVRGWLGSPYGSVDFPTPKA